MLRAIMALALLTVATVGCASLSPSNAYRGYCITGTHQSCPALEGYGDCQPCPRTGLLGRTGG